MKYIIVSLISLCCLLCQAQELPICDTLKTVNMELVKKEIHRLSNTENEQVNADTTLLVINIMNVHLDTLTNEISFQKNKNKQIILLVAQETQSLDINSQSYQLINSESIQLYPIDDTSLTHREIIRKDFECIYFIPSLFSSVLGGFTDGRNLVYAKAKDSPQEFFINEQHIVFTSFLEYIEYEFGSIDNYVKIYNNRLNFHNKMIENFKKLHSVSPNPNIYIKTERIRG
ncbi:MAG: hypothetical protein LBR55_00160 [Bacteroidales bacterium]|jgi:hypothetical protein|nr:hypothetical protein [Bacteroidales bacterium]